MGGAAGRTFVAAPAGTPIHVQASALHQAPRPCMPRSCAAAAFTNKLPEGLCSRRFIGSSVASGLCSRVVLPCGSSQPPWRRAPHFRATPRADRGGRVQGRPPLAEPHCALCTSVARPCPARPPIALILTSDFGEMARRRLVSQRRLVNGMSSFRVGRINARAGPGHVVLRWHGAFEAARAHFR